MPLITLDQARAQARREATYPAEQLDPHINGAEDAASAYLNRRVYADQAALNSARSSYAADMAAATAAHDAAVEAAEALEDEAERMAALKLADLQYREAQREADQALHGIVVNSSIISAILLTFGHLFENRADTVVDGSAVELPNGAKSLLRPYRRVMMP